MDSVNETMPRTYTIRKSPHLGFGFVAGDDFPTIVKVVERNGPSFKLLQAGDVIMEVNGRNVEDMDRRQIIDFIQNCQDEIRITVRQPSYEESIRAKNLADPRFYTLNRPPIFNNFNSHTMNNRHQPNIYPQMPQQSQSNPPPLNRLVTSIAAQQQPPFYPQLPPKSPSILYSKVLKGETPPVQIRQQPQLPQQSRSLATSAFNLSTIHKQQPPQPLTPTDKTKSSNNVLKQLSPTNGAGQFDKSITHGSSMTLGRNHMNYGRHSPLPQRCKSSMDKSNKKQVDNDNHHDEPQLKRSNTMRPMKKPPKEVLEIFQVIIKIFFEIGSTRVLKYNQDTTVGTILETLNARITGNSPHTERIKKYFGLAVTVGANNDGEESKDRPLRRKLMYILGENDSIMKIRQLPYAQSLRIVYRMVYPPNDVRLLYDQDKVAFEYLYQQSCNDLKQERFSPELDEDNALKLSALHLVEYVYSNHSKAHGNSKDPKDYIKLIKKTPGIMFFVPASMAEAVLDKKGKRISSQCKKLKVRLIEQLKKNFEEFDFDLPKGKSTTNLNCYSATSFHELSLPEIQSHSDHIKLLFLKHLSQLPCYGCSKKPNVSESPVERNSAGECSSSLDSVPRTSDSSPLLKQDKSTLATNGNRPPVENPISRLAQMNSIRSLNSSQTPTSSNAPMDQPDMAQTPSIESISSITFNNSPSPQQQPQVTSYSQHNESYLNAMTSSSQRSNGMSRFDPTSSHMEPSPMPRHMHAAKTMDYHHSSIDKLYSQRYKNERSSIDEMLKGVILRPPPSTQILTDQDIKQLLVPPPPRIFN